MNTSCAGCGAQWPQAHRFCATCGSPLADPSAAQQGNTFPTEVGERRSITILFCDLVGSTEIAVRHDPEDVREVLRLYHRAAADAITTAGGSIARFMGDGIMAYFGYPTASDDAARRAIDGGLAAVHAVQKLSDPLLDRLGITPACRVGIHTGIALVGPMGFGERVELDDVVGDTPNIAARLQSEAGPNQVAIGQSTYELVEGWFVCTAMGLRNLRGVAKPFPVYRVVRRTGARNRLEARGLASMAPFVGRGDELAALQLAWDTLGSHGSRAIAIAGSPGIGKSRLALEFARDTAASTHTDFLFLQCEQGSTSKPLAPFQTVLSNAGLDVDAVAGDDRAGWFEHAAVAVCGASEAALLVVIDDAQWADPSTLALAFAMHTHRRPTLTLLTVRSSSPPPNWCEHTELGGLTEHDSVSLAAAFGADADDAAAVAKRTDGVPLYIEETARSQAANSGSIPATLRDLLAANLDACGDAKRLAQIAAVHGRTFRRDDLLGSIRAEDTHLLDRHLADLAARDMIVADCLDGEPAWRFRHSLLHDAAYEAMLRHDRRALHSGIADRMTGSTTDASEHVDVIARHLEGAERWSDAIEAWERAGRLARRRGFTAESAAVLEQAIRNIAQLPAGIERDDLELRIRSSHLSRYQRCHDHADPSLDELLARCHELARDRAAIAAIPFAYQWATHLQALGQYSRAASIAADTGRLLEEGGFTELAPLFHMLVGVFGVWCGEGERARRLLDDALLKYGLAVDAFEPASAMKPTDSRLYPTAGAISMAAIAAALRGDHPEADARIAQGLRLTAPPELGDGRSLVHLSDAMRHSLTGNRAEARRAARSSIDSVADPDQCHWSRVARSLAAWADRDAAAFENAYAALAKNAMQFRPLLLCLRADLRLPDDPVGANALIDEAEALANRTGERLGLTLAGPIRDAARNALEVRGSR